MVRLGFVSDHKASALGSGIAGIGKLAARSDADRTRSSRHMGAWTDGRLNAGWTSERASERAKDRPCRLYDIQPSFRFRLLFLTRDPLFPIFEFQDQARFEMERRDCIINFEILDSRPPALSRLTPGADLRPRQPKPFSLMRRSESAHSSLTDSAPRSMDQRPRQAQARTDRSRHPWDGTLRGSQTSHHHRHLHSRPWDSGDQR